MDPLMDVPALNARMQSGQRTALRFQAAARRWGICNGDTVVAYDDAGNTSAARAGHIPGAVSAPTIENLDGEGRFLPAQELRRRFARLGADTETPTAVYCGSGVTAAHQIVALKIAGIPAALFPGSFSEWSSDPSRPVAFGPEPDGAEFT